jgi:hypothetical protein
MKRQLTLLGTALLLALGVSSQAQACRFAPPKDDAERKADARSTVASATVIIDAEVVQAYKSEAEPAILRARRVIKGPRRKQLFRVAGATSCHIQFTQVGFRRRVLLFGGPSLYTANMYRASDDDINAAIEARHHR